jgi:hypothetical protein
MAFENKAVDEILASNDPSVLLLAWHEAKQYLAAIKAREGMLRTAVFQRSFPAAVEGTNETKFPNGYKLKAVYPFSYTWEDSEASQSALENYEEEFVNKLLRWRPEVSVTGYKALMKKDRDFLAPYFTIKPGSPQMDLLEPGAPGNKR